MDKNKHKLAVFNSPDKTQVRVFRVIPDKATDKTIEINMLRLKEIVFNDDVRRYQSVANKLLYAVLTTSDKRMKEMPECLEDMIKEFKRLPSKKG